MKNLLACIALLAPLAVLAAEPTLFHLAVKDVPVENGKVLDMELQELARAPDTSAVLVTRRSGGSVSTSMFIVRGMCGVMRARGKQNFVTERVAGEGERYTVTFPDALHDPRGGFTLAQCELMHF